MIQTMIQNNNYSTQSQLAQSSYQANLGNNAQFQQTSYQSNLSNDWPSNPQLHQPIQATKDNTLIIIIISMAILIVLAIIIWIIADCIHTYRLMASFNNSTIHKLINDKLGGDDFLNNQIDNMPYQFVIYEIIDNIPEYKNNPILQTIQQNIILRLCYELLLNEGTKDNMGTTYSLNVEAFVENNTLSQDVQLIYTSNQLKLLQDKYSNDITNMIKKLNPSDQNKDMFAQYKDDLTINSRSLLKEYTKKHRDRIGIIKNIISNTTFSLEKTISQNALTAVLSHDSNIKFIHILQYVIVPILILIIIGLVIMIIFLAKSDE